MRRLLFWTSISRLIFSTIAVALAGWRMPNIWGTNARSEIQDLVYCFVGLAVSAGGAFAPARATGKQRIRSCENWIPSEWRARDE